MSEIARAAEDETTRLQRLASEPSLSAWVSANAGSGKTEVLARRVIRLMLTGVTPDEILCLTYTKAAAAEMTNRVFARLAAWIALDDADLRAAIADLTDERTSDATLARARRLFADALETPGGLKIQTIHAFCERLLHLFPFDAKAPAHFEVLDDAGQNDLIEQAIAAIVAGRDGADAADAFARVAEETGDEKFRDLLRRMIAARADNENDLPEALRARQFARLAATLGIAEDETAAQAAAAYRAHSFWRNGWTPVAAALRGHPGATNDAISDALARIAAETDPLLGVEAARSLFLTAAGHPKSPKSLMTPKARAATPHAAAALDDEAARFGLLLDRLDAIATFDRNRALFIVADAALAHYRAAKARRGALDFSDLIEKTRALLANPGIGAWVLYKLDSRLGHILVDEAQDTSEAQWDIIRRLAEEFTSGDGARAADRTVFAVGDEKQSIYSFQGAAPKAFAATRDLFKTRHDDAGRDFRAIPLRVSFRSTAEVLAAVDQIFGSAERSRGLSFGDDGVVVHESAQRRAGDIGFVELWPLEMKADAPAIDDYLDPGDEDATGAQAQPESPSARLARRVAENVRLLIRDGDPAGRPVAPRDVMILVRKRNALFEGMIAALKQRGVPVAGADRLKVGQHIAVLDCLAVARAVLRPDDDYALACALKSPLIGLADDDLLIFAPRRDVALAEALGRAAPDHPRLADAATLLDRWSARAVEGPFAFFARLIESENGRRAFLKRLGAEAGDAIDEFLARALEFERRDGASLASFVAAFERTDIEIKRDLDQTANEVRVMTAHAAKGLEAPIVVLADTTGAPGANLSPVASVPVGGDLPPLTVWSPGASRSAAIEAARATAKADVEDEHRRLLYVALTRARNGLIIAGATRQRAAPDGSWFAHVSAALHAEPIETSAARRRGRLHVQPARDGLGDVQVWMLEGRTPSPGPRAAIDAGADAPKQIIPSWATEPAPVETQRAPPLSPSSAAAAADAHARPFDAAGSSAARARGRLAHRLMELLPNLPAEARESMGLALAARTAPETSAATRRDLVARATAVIEDPRWAVLFGPASRAEVAVAGPASIGGATRAAFGVIDRLAATDDTVWIADYKTSARPPRDASDIDLRIVAQLALYRALVAPLYPGRRVRCVVIWTAGPTAHELDDAALDASLAAAIPPA